MKQNLANIIGSSQAWERATVVINKAAEACNRKGIKITEEEQNILREFRLLATLMLDEKAFDAFAEDVYYTLRAR
jgi:hypothetical protein